MNNKYSGHCFVCGRFVDKGQGWFQSRGSLSKKQKLNLRHPNKWLLRCKKCKDTGNNPLDIIEAINNKN